MKKESAKKYDSEENVKDAISTHGECIRKKRIRKAFRNVGIDYMNAKCFYCNMPRDNPCLYKNLADCKEQKLISDIARIYIDVYHNNIFKG